MKKKYTKIPYNGPNKLILSSYNSEEASSQRSDLVNYAIAISFVGNPYVWGGTSLTNGADCSGFCSLILAFSISPDHELQTIQVNSKIQNIE